MISVYISTRFAQPPMPALSCLLVEDDPVAMAITENWAKKSGLLEIKNKFSDAQEALTWLATHHVDLILLDVEMPTMSGLQMLKQVPQPPRVIIISSMPTYAVDAFSLNVIDYLLKPLQDYPRFLLALEKATAAAADNSANQKDVNNLFVRIDNTLLRIDWADILWLEAAGDYVKIHTPAKVHIVYSTLKKISASLDANRFVRVHRSYMVNIAAVQQIELTNLTINKTVIPVSLSFKDELMAKIKIL
jgi:DNA-binding LytR/AlgR family response regulator